MFKLLVFWNFKKYFRLGQMHSLRHMGRSGMFLPVTESRFFLIAQLPSVREDLEPCPFCTRPRLLSNEVDQLVFGAQLLGYDGP